MYYYPDFSLLGVEIQLVFIPMPLLIPVLNLCRCQGYELGVSVVFLWKKMKQIKGECHFSFWGLLCHVVCEYNYLHRASYMLHMVLNDDSLGDQSVRVLRGIILFLNFSSLTFLLIIV